MREGLKPLLFVLQTPLQDVTASEGGCNTMFGLGLPRLHSSICLISLWLSALKRPASYERGRKAVT